jgi:hypothetical protein
MRHPLAALAVAAILLAALATAPLGCVSLKRTPEARFIVLRSLVEPPAVPSAEKPAGIVGVLPVRLPGHLDRPQLVTWTAPSELRIDEYLRWAEPLDAGITRTLAENLAALLPDRRVIRRPWPAHAALACRVMVELRDFGPQESGLVVLDGRWALLPEGEERPRIMRPVRLERGPLAGGVKGASVQAGVEAMSELLADLGRQISEAIRALTSEPSGAQASGTEPVKP